MSRDKGAGNQLSSEVDASEIPVIRRDYSHLDHLYVYPLGDVHLGAAAHRADRWAEWLDYLQKNKNTSMLGTGDFLNAAIVGAKSDVYEEKGTVGTTKRLLRDQLRPLAEQGRLDVLTPGNHERRVSRAVGDCPILDVAEQLKVPYTPSACLLIYKVGKVKYRIYMRHGDGNGQSLAALGKSALVITADVYVTGHVHAQAATADEYFDLAPSGVRVIRKRRYYVSSGSFLGMEEYAAVRGYKPTRIGAPRIYLDGRTHDVHCSI